MNFPQGMIGGNYGGYSGMGGGPMGGGSGFGPNSNIGDSMYRQALLGFIIYNH